MKLKVIVHQALLLFALTLPVAVRAQSPEWEAPLRASLEQMAATLTETLKPWPVPDHIFRVEDFGAVGDGTTINTAAIQKAIDACTAAGGGVVLVDQGDYVTGTIDLKSGVMLEIAKGARLLGSTNIADYPDRIPMHQTVMDTWMKLTQSLIYAENCERIGIRGEGVIDGRGSHENFPGPNGIGPVTGRPFLIRMIECRKVVVDGIHLRNAAAWMENYLNCDDVILQGINVENQANWNNDGVDLDGCHNVIVRDCFINSEDDGLCFKGAGLRTMENVLVENSKIYSTCNAIKFGTDSQAGFRNVLIRNVEIGGPAPDMPSSFHRRAISGISWQAVDGGTVENILVSQVKMDRTDGQFCLRLGNRGRVKPDMPKPPPAALQHLVFEHITGGDNGACGSLISGIPDARVQGVIFRDVKLSVAGGGTSGDASRVVQELVTAYPDILSFGKKMPAFGFWIRHADDITFDGVTISPEKPDERQPFVVSTDAADISVEGKPFPDPTEGTQ
jgi:hypothetical protein